MLSIFVCEDNPAQKIRITKCIQNYILMEDYDMQVVMATDSPYELLDYIEKEKVAGLYFLDINLNTTINGLELAERIRLHDPRGFIVFITTYDEMLPLTFKHKVEALDFIEKSDAGLEKRICECICNAHRKYTAKTSVLQNHFIIKIEGKEISLDCEKILYFCTTDYDSHRIVVYSEDSCYTFYGDLRKILKSLDKNFFRCHKSYIVNLNKIIELDSEKNMLILDNDASCIASVKGIRELRKRRKTKEIC